MKVMIVGGGGREHALAWKIAQSPKVKRLYAAPGNVGMEQIAKCIGISPSDPQKLANFAEEKDVDLTLVGPELPLSLGIVDLFAKRGLRIFGPSQRAARIESSKGFAKEFMRRWNIPTAPFMLFTDPEEAIDYLKGKEFPLVIKADGLAAGKGSIVARSLEEALAAIKAIMVKKIFGRSGKKVVIENYLRGEEATILVISDGKSFIPLPPAKDYKPIYNGDRGPNTGGMGSYAPAQAIDEDLMERIKRQILQPTIKGLSQEGIKYKGVLYVGLMLTPEGPQVMEYNCRFGDPETQALIPLLRTDLVEIAEWVIEERLKGKRIEWEKGASVCVVLASEGYPGKYKKGAVISGTEGVTKNILLFHAGTAKRGDKLLTNGGRVLGVTAKGKDLKEARENAYKGVKAISFPGMQFRGDIALEGSQ